MTAVHISPSGAPPIAPAAPRRPVAREWLLLALAGLWVLDGLLQLQPYMFTKDFSAETISVTAAGNPGWVASAVHWSATLISDHPVGLNTLFAFTQLALGLGIAYRPTRRLALAASIGWAAAVWYLGEGLGGLLAHNDNPLTGAPGSASLYLLLAVLLWPGARAASAGFPAAGLLTARAAKTVWTVLWAGLALLTLTPTNRAPGAFGDAITGMMGEPAWYTGFTGHFVSLVDGHDLTVAVLLALVMVWIALSVWLSQVRAVRAGLITAVVLCAVYWAVGQAFGMPFMGMSTDPNSGPVLAVIALAYWPARAAAPSDAETARAAEAAEAAKEEAA